MLHSVDTEQLWTQVTRDAALLMATEYSTLLASENATGLPG